MQEYHILDDWLQHIQILLEISIINLYFVYISGMTQVLTEHLTSVRDIARNYEQIPQHPETSQHLTAIELYQS